ncbi:E3 ubiquitin-protein ligase RHF2A [Mucuna pruriens]|uniref:RING-type E3 ubiquitin transferase n=1 Tax=Mucuna pruriens TaxID=157652 RepID=A0A371HFP9_MUCPR|nr:E3 ubiquitin-protein ligase RHF2A [Mucuna pruriens]
MANFTPFSSSSSLSHIPPISAPSSSAPFDDSSDDSCSICLEPFTLHDPSTVTCCKHEYHLHCILEWSQRSKECPICWQSLALKDPASQELLAAVEVERRIRSRNTTNSRVPLEHLNDSHVRYLRIDLFRNCFVVLICIGISFLDTSIILPFNDQRQIIPLQDDSCSDDSDFDDQIMRRLVAAANRARFVQRQERKRSPDSGPSEVLGSNSSMHVLAVQPRVATSPSTVNIQPSALSTTPEINVPHRSRVLYSQSPPESARNPNTTKMLSFPDSIKSKFSAASARYKESISKGTRGLKEKLLAHNVSVKELSKGVQREMNAGITGVARMIERLDLSSKRSSSPLIPVHSGGTSDLPSSGKSVDENGIGGSPSKEIGGAVHDVPSLVTNMQSFQMKTPPFVQVTPIYQTP